MIERKEDLEKELGRAYRALFGFYNAWRQGVFLNQTAVTYHSPSIGAASRFVREGVLDGSEYFVGKPIEVLHEALKP